ncbi:MAG: DNA topoisomerase I, partial [Rhodospirillales bacterium]|nr:DNA topoisomerase I [Rhodospirillales bacterium]
ASLARGMDGATLALEEALGLLSLPRLVGLHPETGQKIEANIGRFGPYVKMGALFASLDRDDNVLHLGLNRAMDLIAKKQESVKTLGQHPKDGADILVRKGRFGPYAQWGNTVATLPKGTDMGAVTLEEAVTLLAEKGKTLAPRGKKGAKAAPKKAAAKPAAKKAAAKPTKKPAAKASAKSTAKPAKAKKTA